MGDSAAWMKEKRGERGWTQQELADRTGMDRGYLASVESGKVKTPSAGVRRKLGEALGVRHVDVLVAAGELTEEEVVGAPRPNPFPYGVDSPRGQLCTAVGRLTDEEVEAVAFLVRLLSRRSSP